MRPIDRRFRPRVAGIDLEQALNYVELSAAGAEFCYEHYTGARLAYRPGRRPVLEAVARRAADGHATPLARIEALAEHLNRTVRWAGYYHKQTGHELPRDQDLSEEQILEQGFGWCNEQARLFCCLTQALGFASRIVFAVNVEKRLGHCMSEVLLDEGWLCVDQSFGYCFVHQGRPVRAVDLRDDPVMRAHFDPICRRLGAQLLADLGREILAGVFDMALLERPLDGLKDMGFHNHFLR